MDDKFLNLDKEELIERFKDATYLPNDEILTLTKIAFKLNKPILIEGPPGTGKTSIAKAIHQILDTKFYRIQCFEGITSEQIIGEFNYQKQLLEIEKSKNKEIRDIFTEEFFIDRPLLKAIKENEKVVLLIDEIDRADEEFEAFLLEALGENQVTIPELGTIKGNNYPIVIMTSNNTRELSYALRRRALYLALDYPTPNREKEIVKLHIPELEEQVIENIISLIAKIRNNKEISQLPSISETIEFANTILFFGKDYLEKPKIFELLGIISKNKADLVEIKKILMEIS